ncbi:PspC domain-containing protein [Winogradskyella sediminis]|uniref:Phage shock protein PspC (Stress-responsive transcriptional regulator) n=1 Tax=Winogradskyella sediminis TaxID=1382466 RepID=A0A1H1VRY3_9FLAO|nr:PspC domain-containing protein [Winogradskyella sediminis]SDS87657.1 Phage shock protein PspC (stress-responsive transcriptional regulator) [Winogradskyella sediminis]
MNKTVNINLAGIFFHIDEDAYLKLSRYLEAIKRSFTDSQGRSEIIADIEARIAELFAERIQNEKQVVGIKLVDEVITIMGQPEDYLVDDEIFEDEPQQQHKQKTGATRRLFRDTDNSYVGGVSAGLGHYFGLDALWVRLLWVLLIFGFGTGILLYILLWALIPEAKTTAEKLTMTGDAVNISNIEKKIKDGIDTVSENFKNVDLKKHGDKIKEGFDHVSDNISETVKNVDFQKQGSKLKSSSQSFFETIGSIIMFFLKVVAKFIGIILIIVGISVLIGLIIAFFTVGITDALHFPGMDFIDASNAANIPIWLMSLLLFFVVGIPFFFVFYLGLKILVNNLKSIGNVAKFTLLGLWIMAIIGLIIMGVKQATEYAYDATIVQEEKQLNISAMDTLNLSMMSHDIYNENFSRNYEHYKINPIDNGQNIISSSDIRIVIKQSSDSLASIKIHSYASGSNYDLARERAQNIHYNYAFNTNKLKLDAYFTTEGFNKFSDQHIEIYLYLPVGTVIHTDNYVSRYRKFYNSPHNLLQRDMENHYYKIISNDTECLDCLEAIEDEEIEKDVDLDDVIEAAAKKIILEDEESSDTSASGVNINISDDDGVNIEVIDN